jgi:hypothetical protein
MKNLTVTRTNCNTFVFSYSDTVKDLTINIREVSLISNWDGNLSLLPIYLTIVIPHVISPSIIPNTYTLELPSDKIYVFEYIKPYPTTISPWYIPSKDELSALYNNLHLQGLGNFTEQYPYWSSSELDANSLWCVWFNDGAATARSKNSSYFLRPIRSFTSDRDYSIGTIRSNGIVFYKDGVNYLECALNDAPAILRCTDDIGNMIGTLTTIFSGRSNTYKMKRQSITAPGPVYCSTVDISGEDEGHFNLTEYSLYTIFCDLLTCRLDLLKRVLGELDNCKEECDCIAVYDYNAFSIIYETIVSLYENIFNILNIDIENTTLTVDEIETLTTFEELMIQYKKYCISCEKPCKNC